LNKATKSSLSFT